MRPLFAGRSFKRSDGPHRHSNAGLGRRWQASGSWARCRRFARRRRALVDKAVSCSLIEISCRRIHSCFVNLDGQYESAVAPTSIPSALACFQVVTNWARPQHYTEKLGCGVIKVTGALRSSAGSSPLATNSAPKSAPLGSFYLPMSARFPRKS